MRSVTFPLIISSHIVRDKRNSSFITSNVDRETLNVEFCNYWIFFIINMHKTEPVEGPLIPIKKHSWVIIEVRSNILSLTLDRSFYLLWVCWRYDRHQMKAIWNILSRVPYSETQPRNGSWLLHKNRLERKRLHLVVSR